MQVMKGYLSVQMLEQDILNKKENRQDFIWLNNLRVGVYMNLSNIFKFLCVVFIIVIVIMLALTLISSYMQDYYKSQLDDTIENTEKLLNKKDFWAKVGEPQTVIWVAAGISIICLLIILVIWIVKH